MIVKTVIVGATSLASAIALSDVSETSRPRFALGGYGDVKYEETEQTETGAYSARFVPIFLFSLNSKMHIEAETEISINADGETEIELEYADLHYFLTDTTTITAGKFLLPFGQFGPNIHPSWINRSPWTPGIYGAHGSSQAMDPLLPILSDTGVAIQKTFVIGDHQKIFVDLYSTNGPSTEAGDHDEEPADLPDEHVEEVAEHGEIPELAFESRNIDNNKNKATGGRIAYGMLPGVELGASFYSANYDDEDRLAFKAQGIDINVIGSHYLLRGEYIRTQTDGVEEEGDDAEIDSYKRSGWYLQGTLHTGRLWPTLTGTELVAEYAETNQISEAQRWMIGINYWLDARSVIKVAYDETQITEEADDQRFAVQLSYGF